MSSESSSPVASDADGARLAALRLLAEQPQLSQRELSAALGLSLGKTHYVLHALLDKGLVKANNFKRSDNKLAYAYVLTPRGFAEKLHLTRTFLSRKEQEFEALSRAIGALKAELTELGKGHDAQMRHRGPQKSNHSSHSSKGDAR